MKKVIYSEEMLSQFRKPIATIFDYLPTKYKATPLDWKVRKFVWAFKNGQFSSYAAKIVSDKILNDFGNLTDIVFACIPASSGEANEKRYKTFSEEVCIRTGATNAFPSIKVEGEKLAIHESRSGKHLNDTRIITFDKDFFKGKKVVVFDDVITKGYSYARFAAHLEKLGASVLGGLFLAKTIVH